MRITLTGILLLTIGCASSEITIYNPRQVVPSLQKSIPGTYEQVFKATQISLADYPIEINDMEAGFLQTTFIRNEQVWIPPHFKGKSSAGYRYTISIQLLRLRNKNRTQVIITKNIEFKSDFFANYKPIKTDGLEEIALLYRIQRELWLQNKLQ